MPPVPVMVLRMEFLSPISTRWQVRAGGLECVARDLVGGTAPGRRFPRLVAHESAIALAVEQREDLLERHAPPPGRQPVERLAGLEPGARHVAVLEVRDLAERHVFDCGQAGAAPLQVIRVEQESTARVRGLRDDAAHDLEVIQLLGLRVELDGELHPMRSGDVGGLAHVRGGARQVTAPAIGRAHHRLAAERARPAAGFVERLHQLLTLGAVGEHPAELDADARDAQAARLDEGQHGSHCFAGGGGAGVAAGVVVLAGLLGAGGLALAYSTACFSSPSACLTSSSALARCPPKWCSARVRCFSASSSDLAAAWIRCSPARVAVCFFSWVNARVPRPRTNPIASTLATITLRFSMRSSAYTAVVSPPSKLMAVPVI